MRDPMLDEEFLRELDQYPHKFLWAKIISLNMDEYPLEEITGKITSGSVNIDGTSVLRRTCSMTMVAQDVNINEFYWGLKTKFRFYIGVENWINPEYPDIIWFNEGMFMITSFNCTAGVNNYIINLQGRDKMTLLNGDLGGVIPASWDFATEDANATDEDGETIYDSTGYAVIEHNQIPIKDIILQAVHEFAQEPWQNIIVNDLDDYGIELLEYQGTTPLYYIIQYNDSGDNSREVVNMTMDGGMKCSVRKDSWGYDEETGTFHQIPGTDFADTVEQQVAKKDENGEIVKDENGDIVYETQTVGCTISQLENVEFTDDTGATGALHASYEKLIERLDPSGAVTETPDYMRGFIHLGDDEEHLYTVAKITRDNGLHVCGYRITDIIYPYDLIAAPGDTVTSVLDKLVQMLGNFEYFYDVEGRFIFQKKRTYLDVSYNNIIHEHSINSEVFAESGEYSSKYSYTFDDNLLVSSIQNSPNLSNLKNDYSLWGQRENGNVTIPIHMRYAIDKKPMYYKAIGGHKYADEGETFITEEGIEYFENLLLEGDEKLTIDLGANVVDWREIIFMMANDYRRWYRDASTDFLSEVRKNNIYNGYDSLYEGGYTGYEKYYVDFEMNMSQGVVAYWRELYNPSAKNQSGRYNADGVFSNDNENIEDWAATEEQQSKDEDGNLIYIDKTDENGNIIYEMDENERYIIGDDGKYVPVKIPVMEEVTKKYNKGDLVFYTKNGVRNIYRSLRDNNTKEPNGTNIWWALSLSQFTYNSEGWNINILNNPEMLNFWFDFIDTTGELNKYSVHNIGLRSKATNDDKIKAIYFRETPNVIFTINNNKTEKDKWVKPGYCYVNIPAGLNALFTISSRGKNAMDVVEEYLYSYTYPATAITLTTIPIYHLTPNTLIYVNDKDTGIIGEYIMQKYSIQLGANAQMSISAVETAKRLY